MEALCVFLGKSIVVSGLLTTWYLFALRGRRLHQYNRFFLLSVLFVSITIPFLHFHLFDLPQIATNHLAPVALQGLPEGNAHSSGLVAAQPVAQPTDWLLVAGVAAAAISIVLLIILLVRVLKVSRMCRRYPATRLQGINLLLTDSPKAPFAFLKYLFWNQSIPVEGEIGQLIFRHEVAHIEQGHTYDKLVCQILTCIFWLNPFYWIIQKELNIVHEFIADEHAVQDNDTEAFALMLLQSYSNGSYMVPQHHFFSSPVKRRLAMIAHTAKPRYTALRRLMVLPLTGCAVLLFSFGYADGIADNIVPAKKKIVVLLDAGHGGSDAGEQYGGYTEKEICLKYAQRIKQLAPAYNVDVQLTRNDDHDMTLADRVMMTSLVHPDMFVSLHVGDAPAKEQAKGDFDIYVSGSNVHARQSSDYSSAIFGAMQRSGIIKVAPAMTAHMHSKGCNCSACAAQAANPVVAATEKESVYVLKNAQVPGMVVVLGNIKNGQSMQQLNDDKRMDKLAGAMLSGIVEGVAAREDITTSPMNPVPGVSTGMCR